MKDDMCNNYIIFLFICEYNGNKLYFYFYLKLKCDLLISRPCVIVHLVHAHAPL